MLELQRNLEIVRRWWWLLITFTVVGGLLAFGLTHVLVRQEYQATALVSLAPAPSGPYGLSVTNLVASADAQLIPTLDTARAALLRLPPAMRTGIDPTKLAEDINATASPDNQILTIEVKWTNKPLVPILANAIAHVFISQERTRLQHRYTLVHSELLAEEVHLSTLTSSAVGTGPASDWLRSQYADAAAKIFQQDADARVQASIQKDGLSLAQPASRVKAVGPRAPLNGVLGAALGLVVALIVAFIATEKYETEESDRMRPVLAHVGE